MDTKALSYDIFISYRHTEHDRAWAKWLLESLETYKVPKSLQKKGFPTRIGKAFRDEDELPTSSDLSTNIQQALEGSRFLVVICSQDTPSSLWVDKEVATFRKLGKGDHIIPLLVEGTPETSFPASLISLKKPVKQADGTILESNEPLEPIAADVRPRADEKLNSLKHKALLRILSAILGCAFDDLRQRDQERQVRKKRMVYSVAAGLVAIIVGGSLYLWDYNRVKVSYYNTMVYRWGVPEGVGKASKEFVSHKEKSYRVEHRQRKVVRAVCQNSFGMLKNDENKESQWLPQYRRDGILDKITSKDHNGKVVQVKKYEFWQDEGTRNPDSAVVNILSSKYTPLHQGFRDADNREHRSAITRHLICFNKNGYPTKILYQNSYGQPKSNQDGSYGKEYKYNKNGLVIKEYNIDSDGNLVENESCVAYIEYDYSQQAFPIKIEYWNNMGKLIDNRDGYAVKICEYDQWCNNLKVSYYDHNKKPILFRDIYHKVTSLYDNYGNKIMWAFYGVDNKLCNVKKEGYAIVHAKYSNKNQIIEETVCDTLDNPTVSKGFSRSISEFNGAGNLIKRSFWGPKGEPAYYNCVHTIVSEYNDAGDEITRIYYDSSGNIACSNDGVAVLKFKYDEEGRGIERRFYDNNNNPTISSVLGYSMLFDDYDEKGNLIKQSIYDIYKKPILHKNKYWHYMCVYYNDQGLIIEVAYYGKNNEPILNSDNYCKVMNTYDSAGNKIETRYVGTDKKLINCKEGYARKTIQHDDLGREIGEKCFLASGKELSIKESKKDNP